jgi:hypothetical protein
MAAIADSEWSPSKSGLAYNAKHSHAFIAPVVGVEAVHTDPEGPVIGEIRSRFQDAAALDMESHGLAAGSDIHDLPVLVVRGISDFLGDKANPGNDDLQPVAAGNAAALLVHMLYSPTRLAGIVTQTMSSVTTVGFGAERRLSGWCRTPTGRRLQP